MRIVEILKSGSGAVALMGLVAQGCADGGIDHGDVGIVGDVITPVDSASDTTSDIPSTDTLSDDVQPADTAEDGAADIPDVSPDTDTTSPVDPDGRCAAGFACDQRNDAEGRCPGTCVDVDGSTRCRGQIVGGLCEISETPIPVLETQTIDFGDFTVTPVRVPANARVGETHRFEVRLTNDTDATLNLPFYWKTPGTWSIANASWERATGFRLPPRVSVLLTADITAVQPTLFVQPNAHIVSFNFDEKVWEAFATIQFQADDAIACGSSYFPPTFCSDESCTGYGNYFSARCCDGVFYPGATCCVDDDCGGGVCSDGRCVTRLPYLGSANNLPIGNQRVVLVLVDSHPEYADDPCANRVDQVAAPLELATVDNWFHEVALRRLGRETMDVQWTVLGGISTSDFQTGEDRSWYTFSQQLDSWLADRGCPILGKYDKVLVAASTVDLYGFGGVYFSKGEIAMFNAVNPYLTAHELAHSWGATDLYLDLGGRYQYARSLMASWLSNPPYPNDSVVWAEMGYGDVNRNRVVDVAEYAAIPETLAAIDARAVITPKDSVEISFDIVGLQDGVPGRVFVPSLDFNLPDYTLQGQMWVQGDRPLLVVDRWQVDLDRMIAAGTVAIDIVVRHTFTDASWTQRTLTLDTRLEIPLTDNR